LDGAPALEEMAPDEAGPPSTDVDLSGQRDSDTEEGSTDDEVEPAAPAADSTEFPIDEVIEEVQDVRGKEGEDASEHQELVERVPSSPQVSHERPIGALANSSRSSAWEPETSSSEEEVVLTISAGANAQVGECNGQAPVVPSISEPAIARPVPTTANQWGAISSDY